MQIRQISVFLHNKPGQLSAICRALADADINIAAKSYRIEVFKTSAVTGEPLLGATFGLYNENGGLITTGNTDVHGEMTFQTNVVKGIILREHVLYYVQEIKPPSGYRLDETPYWFCFCDQARDSCEICNQILANTDGVRVPFEHVGAVHITNELMKYQLPATGGFGVYPLIFVSVICLVTPLIYRFIRRRKRERRGVG